nr:unnamed protein product [Digitaria exilis]
MALADGGPDALVLQLRPRAGYAHLTLVAIDPTQCLAINLPFNRKIFDDGKAKPATDDPKKKGKMPYQPKHSIDEVATNLTQLHRAYPVWFEPSQELTPHEQRRTEVLLFTWLAIADVEAYIAMTEEEVEEEYCREGKLHMYNPDKEWQQRLARLTRKWPMLDGFILNIDE